MSSPLLATPLPFGWLEIGAFDDAETAEAFVRSRLKTDPAGIPADVIDQVATALREAHGWTAGVGWQHLGVLVTSVSEGNQSKERRLTAWTVGVITLPALSSRDINPAGLIERLLPGRGLSMDLQTIRLPDGREAVSATGPLDAVATVPGGLTGAFGDDDPASLGLVTTWVPLPEGDALLGVVAVALRVDELAALQLLTVEMAAGAHLVDDSSTLPADRVLVDPARTLHTAGFLPPEHEEQTVEGSLS